MSCGVDHRCGLGLVLPWLWLWLAAIAPIRPLAWEPPYATSVAQKEQKTNKKKKKKKKKKKCMVSYKQAVPHIYFALGLAN